jgi:rubredoxin
MRYLCTNCRFIYDEGAGEENVAHGTRFEELRDGFECPVCWEGQESFHEITEEVNQIADNPYDHLEIDHFIETKIEWEKLIVTIWNEIHPMGESHRITSVSLYDEYWDLVEEKFMDFDEDPIIEFDFDDLGEYEIRCRCSLHGVWGKKFVQ